MEITDDDGMARLRQAAGLLGGPVARFDRAGLVALGGAIGPARVTLIRAEAGMPAIAIVESQSGRPFGTFAALSGRERQVAALIGDGRTNREIAGELWISVATVKDHVHHILRKTGLANRAAIAGRWQCEEAA